VQGGKEISFHTPDLSLDNSQVIWVQEEGGTTLPYQGLIFSLLPIDPAD